MTENAYDLDYARRAMSAVYLVADEAVARDLSGLISWLIGEVERLRSTPTDAEVEAAARTLFEWLWPPSDPASPAWDDVEHRVWLARARAVLAAAREVRNG